MKDNRLSYIIETLEPPANKRLWYGGVYTGESLIDVDVEQALWKPSPERHSIWEYALHIAYWKYFVRSKLVKEELKGFDRSPDDWPEVSSQAGEKEWIDDKQLLDCEHRLLIEAIKSFDESLIDKMVYESPDSKWTFADILMGIVTHDIYHTGQIMLMKRLYKHDKGEVLQNGNND